MIEVKELTKRFYDVVALDRISFEVGRDEVVGFLGPNGAGKSTTLKILTCFMPATSGSATVAGMDVFSQSLAVRRSIGYLPEQVPLYGDMRVREYLMFRGRLKGVPGRELKSRTGEVLDICGLEDMAGRIVGQLSKGYRQRVGLADVLIHNPPILLLDEPTGGLDPSQRREVRELVERLGEAHTVFLSSHILAEVESMCSRVIIIKKGRIIADGRPDELVAKLKGGQSVRIEAGCPLDEVLSAFNSSGQKLDILDSGEEGGRSYLAIPPVDAHQRASLLRHLVDKGVPVDDFRTESFSLEEIYMRLTLEQELLDDGVVSDGAEGEKAVGEAAE
jgi:ABC-2 type transport system ATP-binding protein